MYVYAFVVAVTAAQPSPVTIEPPLDPVAGTFAAVAYWSGDDAPGTVTFRLSRADGVAVWTGEAAFAEPLRRASARCDTAALPGGAYTLAAECGGHRDAVEVRLEQGREVLPELRPFRSRMLWMPMTGYTDAQLDEAAAAGYDTLFTKGAPPYAGPGQPLDFSHTDAIVRKAQERGMKVVMGWLLWAGLPPGEFYLECADGRRVPNRIDPCWPEAMAHVRRYAEQLLDHYMGCRDVIGLAPTWGIYGEGGYAEFDGGYGEHTLRAFNRWWSSQGMKPGEALPQSAGTWEALEFHRFRFENNARVWGALNTHIRRLEPNGIKIGAWQEIYNGLMYQLALNEVPGADFAVNEMCFPWGTTYDQPRALGETMGIRYKCGGFEDYKDYYLPLIARKWAEGQQAIGCQLSNDYADKNYAAWPPGRAEELRFDAWEDLFAPAIRRVRDTEIVEEPADVAYVQMTYPAAVYPDAGNTVIDINLYEIVLRMYGVRYDRIPITRLQRLDPEDLAPYKLIVLPCAWYLSEGMWRTLRQSGACVLLTGGVMQADDRALLGAGESRELAGLRLTYGATTGGVPTVEPDCPPVLVRGLTETVRQCDVRLPEDLGLAGVEGGAVRVRVGGAPLLIEQDGIYLISNRLLYACAYDPDRTPPDLGGSRDVSANEGDPWGLAASDSPANRFGERLLRNVIEHAGARVRIPEPPPRYFSAYLGDHTERVNVTHNIVVNQDAAPHTVTVRCERPVLNAPCRSHRAWYEADVSIPPYDFVALEYGAP